MPFIPKDELSKVLVRFWWDNFQSTVENKQGAVNTCHGVAYTEESSETIERNSDIEIPRTQKRSLCVTQSKLPSKNIIPYNSPTLFDDIDQGTYSDMYASTIPLIWKMQRQLH